MPPGVHHRGRDVVRRVGEDAPCLGRRAHHLARRGVEGDTARLAGLPVAAREDGHPGPAGGALHHAPVEAHNLAHAQARVNREHRAAAHVGRHSGQQGGEFGVRERAADLLGPREGDPGRGVAGQDPQLHAPGERRAQRAEQGHHPAGLPALLKEGGLPRLDRGGRQGAQGHVAREPEKGADRRRVELLERAGPLVGLGVFQVPSGEGREAQVRISAPVPQAPSPEVGAEPVPLALRQRGRGTAPRRYSNLIRPSRHLLHSSQTGDLWTTSSHRRSGRLRRSLT